jgi:hypothetical protein
VRSSGAAFQVEIQRYQHGCVETVTRGFVGELEERLVSRFASLLESLGRAVHKAVSIFFDQVARVNDKSRGKADAEEPAKSSLDHRHPVGNFDRCAHASTDPSKTWTVRRSMIPTACRTIRKNRPSESRISL